MQGFGSGQGDVLRVMSLDGHLLNIDQPAGTDAGRRVHPSWNIPKCHENWAHD